MKVDFDALVQFNRFDTVVFGLLKRKCAVFIGFMIVIEQLIC